MGGELVASKAATTNTGVTIERSRQMILVVVHTFHEHMHQVTVRIISVRGATPRERRQYEEAI